MPLNIFGQPPEAINGLLGVDPEKLRKQAMMTGLINTALAYAAQPKNQGYGSAFPYAGRALLAGQIGAQGVYQNALADVQIRQQQEELKRKQEQDRQRQSAIEKFGIDNPDMAAAAMAFPESIIPQAALKKLEPTKRTTFVAPDGSIRFNDTGELAIPDNVAQQKERETIMAPNGMLIYKDNGEPVTNRNFSQPKEPKEIKLYGDTPVPTSAGYVYMPTAEGLRRGLQPAAIPGIQSPDQEKQKDQQQKVDNARRAASDTANTVISTVEKAKSVLNDGFTVTSGLPGALASKLSMPGRVELEGYLDTIKANLSFETLSAMKAASPTGGALGSVSDNELRLLGSTVASLDPRLPAKTLKNNLDLVAKRYKKIQDAIETDKNGGNVNLMPKNEQIPNVKRKTYNPSTGRIE
jgi:hypothetical protein